MASQLTLDAFAGIAAIVSGTLITAPVIATFATALTTRDCLRCLPRMEAICLSPTAPTGRPSPVDPKRSGPRTWGDVDHGRSPRGGRADVVGCVTHPTAFPSPCPAVSPSGVFGSQT